MPKKDIVSKVVITPDNTELLYSHPAANSLFLSWWFIILQVFSNISKRIQIQSEFCYERHWNERYLNVGCYSTELKAIYVFIDECSA